MKKNRNRRSFLANLTLSGIGASLIPSGLLAATNNTAAAQPGTAENNEQGNNDAYTRSYNGAYKGKYLERVAFPIGGIGTGMFCVEGTGAISHMSVRHNPEMFFEPAMFAAISIKGMNGGARVLEKNIPDWKKFGMRDSGLGGTGGATWGLPRFEEAEFLARFPFAEIKLSDSHMPLQATIKAWSPFTPGDEDNSSLPVGGLEYQFINTSSKTQDYVFSYNARNFMHQQGSVNSVRPIQNGFVLSAEGTKDNPQKQGHFAIFTNEANTIVDHCWFRGNWFDPLTMAWNTIKDGNTRSHEPVEKDAPGGSLFVPFQLKPGEKKTVRLMMAWYVPDTKLNPGEAAGGVESPIGKYYKPWYSKRFASIEEVAAYWNAQYDELQKRSTLFKDTFYKSTLPPEVLEAVAANLTILKSPTVMRQYDGRFWCWEGCGDTWGSCHGSCTHVWNYAQAVSHLFPSLERSLRHTEFNENQNEEGHQGFRANLPITPLIHNFHSAADGQLGGIMKVYREWRVSGDDAWLKNIYPKVKRSMEYCIRTWDPDGNGIVKEPHHNTYDIEFWGPTGMGTSFYLGALQAMTKMSAFMGEDSSTYANLYANGKKKLETDLYNGEYFIQHIQWTDLHAPDPIKAQSFHTQYTEEARALLEKEGPKYQYGTGCLSDGILGSWIARVCGLDEVIDTKKATSHLMAVHKYNLKKKLNDHANPQRPTFALGTDGGLLLCSWPKGGMLSLPFVYSNEVWTGIEYQVASHLMLMGKVKEGLDIVQTCRNRYDGSVRNPFNEYECGHWYARALSSYGLLQGLTGVRYDAVEKNVYIDSKVGDFTSFISTATGFGTVSLRQGKPYLKVVHGTIPATQAIVSGKKMSLA